jgi:hypothetical protein
VEVAPGLPHSGLGITSFIISVAAGITYLITLALAPPDGVTNPQYDTISGSILCLGSFVNFVGIGFGIAGIAQKDRRKLFSVLGLVFNITDILFLGVIMVVGLIFLASEGAL